MPKNIADIVYPERKFGGFTCFDGTVAYYSRIQGLLKPGDVVLDLGCGRGRNQRSVRFSPKTSRDARRRAESHRHRC